MDANTATVVTSICAAIPPTIFALAAWVQGRANGSAQKITAGKADVAAIAAAAAGTAAGTAALKAEVAAGLASDASGKADLILAGNEKIHELVNSGSDKMKLEIAALKTALDSANTRTDSLAATIERLLAAAVAKGAV